MPLRLFRTRGYRRLAIGLSVVWILGLYFLTEANTSMRLFLLLGLLPVLVAWTGLWVVQGFRRDRQEDGPGLIGRWRRRG